MSTKFSQFNDASSLQYEVGLANGQNAKRQVPKKYVALLTQSGTNAPVATILENTLGGSIVWARFDSGTFTGTLAGAFKTDKTILFLSSTIGPFVGYAIFDSEDQFTLSVADPSDGSLEDDALVKSPIVIIVYP